MFYKIRTDVMFSQYYELEAANKAQAQEMVLSGDLEPLTSEPVTSPMIVHTEEIRRGKSN